jgi:hypothetical protein
MPVIPHKPKTASSVPLKSMSDAEFLAMAAQDRKTLKDQINRRTTAAMLGTCIRTLQRWHHENYGPKRISKGGPIRYSRAQVEAWVAEHGQGSHRPRSNKGG